MPSFDPAKAVRTVRDRTFAAAGFDLAALKAGDVRQGEPVNEDADTIVRRLLVDLVQPQDMDPLLELLMPMAREALEAFVPMVLRSLAVSAQDRDEPDENGNEHDVQITVRASEELGATVYTMIGQHIGIGLLMRREGDLVLPSPASLDKPSHGGRPE